MSRGPLIKKRSPAHVHSCTFASIKAGKTRLSRQALIILPYICLSYSYIYWTNWGQAPHIERARLGGTERRALVYNGIKFPKGLALDELGKKLFWADTDDNKHGIIEAVSLDGLDRSVIFYEQGYHPFCLDVFEDYVYWADWGRNAIMRIKSLGGEAEVIIDGLNKPMGLKILHPRESRPGTCSDSPFSRKTLIIERVSLGFRQLQKSSLFKFPRKELVAVFRQAKQHFWAFQNRRFV